MTFAKSNVKLLRYSVTILCCKSLITQTFNLTCKSLNVEQNTRIRWSLYSTVVFESHVHFAVLRKNQKEGF